MVFSQARINLVDISYRHEYTAKQLIIKHVEIINMNTESGA
jgi:hypothetical protein